MLREIRVAALLGPLVLAVACADTTSGPPANQDSPVDQPQISDYVTTPAGLYHRSCVYELPDGSIIKAHGTVVRPDRSIFQAPDCPYPVLEARIIGATALSPQTAVPPTRLMSPTPTNSGWIEFATMNAPANWSRIRANWTVPPIPLAPYTSSTQTYFTFPGIQYSGFILQPVIQFGVSAAGGGSFWSMASWRCGPPGGPCFHSSLKAISAGDAIFGDVASSNCSGGTCTWTVISLDVTTGQQTVLTANDTQGYFQAVGGSVEVYGLTSCDQYPINGITFGSLGLYDPAGTQVTPTWSPGIQGGLSPSCGFSVSAPPTSVSLLHNAATTTARAAGAGLTASIVCLCNTPAVIKSITASGNTITLRDNGGHTGTITLTGATATGGLTASLPPCVCAQPPAAIKSLSASGNTLTITDNGGHTGTMTFSGATLSSLSGSFTASITCLCNTSPAITSSYALGTNGFRLADNGGHIGYIKFN